MLPRPAESLQNSAGFKGKLEHTGSAEKEKVASVSQSEQLASTPEPSLPKEKGTKPSVQIVRWERVKESESHTLAGERGFGAEAWGGKRVDSTEKEGRFQGGEGGQAQRISLGDVGECMSGCKRSPKGSAKS